MVRRYWYGFKRVQNSLNAKRGFISQVCRPSLTQFCIFCILSVCIFMYARAELYEVTCLVIASLPDDWPVQDRNMCDTNHTYEYCKREAGKPNRYSDSLGSSRSGDRTLVVAMFFAPVQTCQGGPPSLLYTEYRVFSAGLKQPGRGVDQSPPCSAEVNKRI
jgi:hypothetical protein